MPNPQVCMFCRYRRTPVQGAAAPSCNHAAAETATAGAPPVQQRSGLPATARRRAGQGGIARYN